MGGHELVGKGTDHATPPCHDWLPEDWLAGWARETQVLRHHLLEHWRWKTICNSREVDLRPPLMTYQLAPFLPHSLPFILLKEHLEAV